MFVKYKTPLKNLSSKCTPHVIFFHRRNMHIFAVFRKINTVKVKFQNVYAVNPEFWTDNCSQNKLRICEGKNLSGTAFTEAASKVTNKLHLNKYELCKKAGPQISLAQPVTFNNPDKECWFVTAVVGLNKEKKLGYNEFDIIDASKEVNRQVTEICVQTLSQGATRSLNEYLDYPEHGSGRNCGVESFQFDSVLSILAKKMISHNVVEDILREFCPCGIKTKVSDKDQLNFKKINWCSTVAPGLCKPLVVSKAIFDTYGVYPLKMPSGTTKLSSCVFMGINHKSSNLVNCNCKNCLAKAFSIRYEQNSYHSELILDLGVFTNEVYTKMWENSTMLLCNLQKFFSQCCRASLIAYWIIFYRKINLQIMASFMKGKVQHY